MPLLNNLE